MAYFGKQNPMQTNYAEDKEQLAQMEYFTPFMQMMKQSSEVQAPSAQASVAQPTGGQELAKPIDINQDSSTSREAQKSGSTMADVGGAAIKGIGAVLTGIGTEAIKREAEERMAAAKAKSNVLGGQARIGSGVSRSKSDILSKLASVLPIVRR